MSGEDGIERNMLTDFLELQLDPLGPENFLGPVVFLTNKRSFSATEDFALMMKALPQVTQIGGPTLGGFGTGPSLKVLSNGWVYRVSRKVSYDLNMRPIIGGIVPDEIIIISDEDATTDRDRILERAIEILE